MSETENIELPEGFSDKNCLTCGDYHGKRVLWDLDVHATCHSEEVMKLHHKPLDATLLPRYTVLIGCRFYRKLHSNGTLASCVTKQLEGKDDS
jgi:hypothetical protein